jgi:hypothetical protein
MRVSVELYLRPSIYIAITVLDIIHHTVFYLMQKVMATAFRLRLQVEPTRFGPTSSARLWVR